MSNKKPSQASLAAALALTPGRITALKKKGMPIYSVEAARAWRAQNIAPVPTGKPANPAPVGAPSPDAPPAGYELSRARREAAEARMAERRDAELAGQLIRVDAVRAVWAAKITGARDALLQIPSRLAPVLAVESDLVAVATLLEAAIHQAMEEISRPQMDITP